METCVKSGPFAPRALPRFLATMSRSDSRPRPPRGYGFPRGVARRRAPRRVSQDPRLVCRHAPSPITPSSPMRACARCFRIGGRLQHLRERGHCYWFHEAESGSLALGSRLRSSRPSSIVRPVAIARPDRSASRSQLPFYAGPELHGERAIHMADTSQSARQIRVNLAHRSNGVNGVNGEVSDVDRLFVGRTPAAGRRAPGWREERAIPDAQVTDFSRGSLVHPGLTFLPLSRAQRATSVRPWIMIDTTAARPVTTPLAPLAPLLRFKIRWLRTLRVHKARSAALG